MINFEPWPPSVLAIIKQFASDSKTEYLPPQRDGYSDAPCARNRANGREVVYFNNTFDLWTSSNELYKASVSRDEAMRWIKD